MEGDVSRLGIFIPDIGGGGAMRFLAVCLSVNIVITQKVVNDFRRSFLD